VLAGSQSFAERDGRSLIHMNEIAVRLDGAPGSRDPRGMAAKTLATDLHAVTVDEAPLRNLLLVVERCYLRASGLVPAPYASALGVTTDEERRLGVTCVDIGAGTTTLAMFAEGRFLNAGAAPFGGNHITFDIARALHTPLAEAERIKALYGSLVRAQSDEHEHVSYPAAGEEEGGVRQVTKARLAEVIRPRVEALVDLVRGQIEGCEMGAYAGRCIVVTGGVSQLVGLTELIASELGRPVRVGRPQAVSGLPPVVSTPAFATVSGLLKAESAGRAGSMSLWDRAPASRGYLERVGMWLRQGF
jgi:cell division protein FtsA